MNRLIASSLLALLVHLAAGCAANPIGAWQAHLEAYVADQGNGDLNVLRRPDRKPSENDFNMISAWLFTRGEKLEEFCARYERIRRKTELAIAFYESIDRRFEFSGTAHTIP